MRNIVFILLIITSVSFAQVGVRTVTPSSAAVLHLEAANYNSTKVGGFIMPIVTQAEEDAIPVDTSTLRDDGLMVFVSDASINKWCWDIYDAEQDVWRSMKCNTPVAAVCDTQIYLEDFSSYVNETGIKEGSNNGDYPGGVTWTLVDILGGITTGDHAMVVGGAFELNDTNGPISFTTEAVDISGFATVCFSVDIDGRGVLEYDEGIHGSDDTNNNNDYVNVEYSVDNGATWNMLIDYNGNGSVNHTLTANPTPGSDTFPDDTVSVSGLSGTFLLIRITSQNWAGNEFFAYDNILVEGGN